MIDNTEADTSDNNQPDGLYRLLVQSVIDYAVFLLDPSGYIMTWNEGARRIKGYSPDEIIGKHFSIFYPPNDVASGKPDRELVEAAEVGRWEEEGWRIRKDGSRFWASVVITALFDDNRRLVGFAKVTRDLSERKRAEDERTRLLEMEREARTQAEIALSELQSLQRVTEAALAHLNLDELLHEMIERIAEVLDVDTVTVLLVDEQQEGFLVARASAGLDEEVARSVRVPIGQGFAGRIAAEGQPRSLVDVGDGDVLNPLLRQRGLRSLLGVPLLVEGKVLGVLHVGSLRDRRFTDADMQFLQVVGDRVALAIDRTYLVEAAQRAQNEAELAEAMVRARDEFLSVAAHELKTPMTSLRIATQMLLRRLDRGRAMDPRTIEQTLRTIDLQTEKLSRLVLQLLETVRLQSGRMELNRAHSNLTDLIRSTVEQVQAQSSRHELVFSAPSTIWARVDPLRIEQVVHNLLENAVKFSPDGGRIDIELAQPTSQVVLFAVRDRGLGVSPEHRPHLFERFYQAHHSDHRSGMGLGLFISREIVETHGGRIQAEFPADGGTRVAVELPSEPGASVREGAA